MRCKFYRINSVTKNRIKLFIEQYYDNEELLSVYIGGSQSKFSNKSPKKDSDIDLYIFKSNTSAIIHQLLSLEIDATLCLGVKINAFEVSNKFKSSVIIGMEKLI